jgi:hypothetical protein
VAESEGIRTLGLVLHTAVKKLAAALANGDFSTYRP